MTPLLTGRVRPSPSTAADASPTHGIDQVIEPPPVREPAMT
jgi:hypothetical protein